MHNNAFRNIYEFVQTFDFVWINISINKFETLLPKSHFENIHRYFIKENIEILLDIKVNT